MNRLVLAGVWMVLLGWAHVPAGGRAAAVDPLTWAPPPLTDPITVEVPIDPYTIRLEPDQDYIVQMPAEPVLGAVSIDGGRNVVMIGGEISIPWQGDEPYIAQRTGLKIANATGTVHIEGLLLHGDDIGEGIQIDAPQAIVQIQNVAVLGIHARDQVEFSDNHPDLIQPYGSFRELRVDRFTGSSDYQGFFLKCNSNCPFGPVTIKRVNLIGMPTARFLIWFDQESHTGPVVLEDFWVDIPEEREGGLGRSVYPDERGDLPDIALVGVDEQGRTYVTWPPEMLPLIEGRVTEGRPPQGDFVLPETVGLNYVSPGYLGA